MTRGRRIGAALAALVAVALVLLFRPEEPPRGVGSWMAGAGVEPRAVVVDGMEVRYVRRGRGPAVVLLHGFASSLYTWKDVLPALAAQADVVALDLPGYGASGIPAPVDPERYPSWVLGALDALGIGRASVVGNSLGGAVAVAIAAGRPERVERLVLADAAGFNFAPEDRPWLLRAVASPLGAILQALPPRRALFRLGLEQVFHDDARATADRVDEYLAPYLRPGAVRASREVLAAAGGLGFPGIVHRVRAPTLIVWGAEDRWIPPAHARRFADAIPGSRVVVLPACGHLPQEERPADFLAAVAPFLR